MTSVVTAPAGLALDVESLPSRGQIDAPLAVVEFSDYECEFCSEQ